MGRQYSANTFDQMTAVRQAAAKAPMLEKDHELALARRWRHGGDVDALQELVGSYLRLVLAIADRFRNYGLPLPDLMQEGTVGLMEAAARFEPERNLRFSTYASWWVRASIQDFVLRNWSIVRTGTSAAHKKLFFNFRRLRARLGHGFDGRLGREQRALISDQLDVPVRDVEIMEGRLSGRDASLNAPTADGEAMEWQDLLTCERTTPDEIVKESHDGAVRQKLLKAAVGTLNDREALIIKRRRLTDQGVTLAQLGCELGISKERVRQIEGLAMEKMRDFILDTVGDPAAAGITYMN